MRQSIFQRAGVEAVSIADGMQRAGVDYTVKKVPLFGWDVADGLLREMPGTFGLQTSRGAMLKGAVGNDYKPVQHEENLQLAEIWAQRGYGKVRAVGRLPNSGAYALLEMPQLGRQEGGDPVEWSIILRSSHSGSNAAILVSQQIWCLNQLPRLSRGAGTVRLVHSGDVQLKLAQMQEAVALSAQLAQEEATVWGTLRQKRVSPDTTRAILASWMDRDAAKTEAALARVNTQIDLAMSQPTMNNGTAMGILDRMTSFLDHGKKRNGGMKAIEAQVASTIDGTIDAKRRAGLALVLSA